MSDKIPVLDSEACYLIDLIKEKLESDEPDYDIRDHVYEELYRFMRVNEAKKLMGLIEKYDDKETDKCAKSFNYGYKGALTDYFSRLGIL